MLQAHRVLACAVGSSNAWWLFDACEVCVWCRYQKLLAECSPVRLLDLKDMQKQV